jgi:probable HAF family extracellular repeat protein
LPLNLRVFLQLIPRITGDGAAFFYRAWLSLEENRVCSWWFIFTITGADMKRTAWSILGMALLAVFLLAGPLGAVTFIYEDLGDLGAPQYGNEAFGINDAGQVVGDAYTGPGSDWPFLKSPGQAMQALPCLNPPGTWPGEAHAINSAGIIVGWVYNGGERNACQWVKPILSKVYFLQPLGTLGGIASDANAINQGGQVVGWSWTLSGDTRGFVKSQGQDMKSLNPLPGHSVSYALGINTSGGVCGVSSKTGEQEPCLWIFVLGGGYVPQGLGSLGYYPHDGKANGLNDSNQIVGYSRVQVGTKHAFLWTQVYSMQDLGLLPGGIDSEAMAINNAGWVVGTASTDASSSAIGQRAFLSTRVGSMQDLNKLVVNLPPGIKLMSANSINSRGEIVGQAVNFNNYETNPYRLKPIGNLPFSALLLLD